MERVHEWWNNAPTSGLQCKLQSESGEQIWNEHHNCELTYRVTIENYELVAVCVHSKNPTLRIWLAIVGFTLSAATIAAVFVIRRRRGGHTSKMQS